MPPLLSDTDASRALRQVQTRARQQWHRDGRQYDIAEYIDAGMAALMHCLGRYDPSRGATFVTYADYRIRGAVSDARATYQRWRGSQGQPAQQRPEVTSDPVLRARLVREARPLSRCQRDLLEHLVVRQELVDIARAEGVAYSTVYARYRDLLTTLKTRLTPRPQ